MRALTIVALACAAGLASADEPSSLTYRFDEVKSRVYQAPKADERQERRVVAGDTAPSGDLVRTGFWARAVLSVPERQSRFEVESSTRVRLAGGDAGVLLVLEKGRLKAFFEKLTEGSSVERRVSAPGALLAVRGTRYGLEVGSDQKAVLAVFEGTVEVIPTTPGAVPVRVEAGQTCVFGPHSPPMTASMRAMGMSENAWGSHAMNGMSQGQPGSMSGAGPGGMTSPGHGSSTPGGQPMGGGHH